jgi:hypothetical protein
VYEKIEEINISIHSTGRETHVVLVPVDAADLLSVKAHVFRALAGVEVEDPNFLVLTGSCE